MSTIRQRVVAMAPMSWDGAEMLDRLGVEVVPNDQFLCSADEFAAWADGRRSVKMEDFYRHRRRVTGVLMDGDEPAGGRWNFDHDNREPPPTDGRSWPRIEPFELDEIDREVIDALPEHCWGDAPSGVWPTGRAQALQRLEEFVTEGLAVFGPHEDAMLAGEWKLAHSVLSSSLNIGLLHPTELVDAAEAAYRDGQRPHRIRRGLHPAGHGLARVRLGRLLALDARLPRARHVGRRSHAAAGVHR